MVALNGSEYLVSHGGAGEFGRFRAAGPLACRRGDRVVVSGRQGLELGVVLCQASARHARLLADAPVGELLRQATPEDEELARRMAERGQALFEDGRRLAAELGLAVEVLDAEVSLDGRQGAVQYLAAPGLDLDPFAAALARRHGLFVLLHNLAAPVPPAGEEAGCGEPNCGRAHGGGGCATCSSGGGCATGCGSGPVDVSPYFAHLRAQMEKRNFTPLL